MPKQAQLKKANDNLFLNIYKIGDIYITTNSENPADRFGGQWEQIQDKFLLCAGSTYSAGTTGGNASHVHTSASHTHTLSDYGVAKVTFTQGYASYASVNASYTTNWGGTFTYSSRSQSVADGAGLTGRTDYTTPGNTGSSSNIPPYLAVYVWKRIA